MENEKTSTDRISKLVKKANYSSKKRKKNHAYKHEKAFPIPAGIGRISVKNSPLSKRVFGKAKVLKHNSHASTLEQIHCTSNQNYPLFFIEKSDTLLLRKIKNLRIKENLIAIRNIKRLSHQMQQWIYSQSIQDIKVLKKDQIEFQNLLEKREERHFRIDRIMTYLSEI